MSRCFHCNHTAGDHLGHLGACEFGPYRCSCYGFEGSENWFKVPADLIRRMRAPESERDFWSMVGDVVDYLDTEDGH